MANRPVFVPGKTNGSPHVATEGIDFIWVPGMAKSQKQKSIRSLHDAARDQLGVHRILEISSKSEERLGIDLSAFFLKTVLPDGRAVPLENAFQSSKVFAEGGPFVDLLNTSPLDAKRDVRLKTSGALQRFEFFNTRWPLEPKTIFYDWLYVSSLRRHEHLANAVLEYDAFTDIEFNPKKSINCQAYSAALFSALYHQGHLAALETPKSFTQLINRVGASNSRKQPLLF
jgi:hypothetical protein